MSDVAYATVRKKADEWRKKIPKKQEELTQTASKKKRIPKELIYEEMDGKPIYYAGYQEVINNNKTLDDITGSSYIQSVIIKRLFKYLLINVEEDGFEVLSSELGLHLKKGSNLAADIAIYRIEQLEGVELTNKYISIPPEVVVESARGSSRSRYES